jgi:hypothetical protein
MLWRWKRTRTCRERKSTTSQFAFPLAIPPAGSILRRDWLPGARRNAAGVAGVAGEVCEAAEATLPEVVAAGLPIIATVAEGPHHTSHETFHGVGGVVTSRAEADDLEGTLVVVECVADPVVWEGGHPDPCRPVCRAVGWEVGPAAWEESTPCRPWP